MSLCFFFLLLENCTNKVSNIVLGPLLPHVKSTVKNLGVILDMDFKLDKQINSIVMPSVLVSPLAVSAECCSLTFNSNV